MGCKLRENCEWTQKIGRNDKTEKQQNTMKFKKMKTKRKVDKNKRKYCFFSPSLFLEKKEREIRNAARRT